MDFIPFVEALSQQLMQPLPGLLAQLRMSALSHYPEVVRNGIPEDAVRSSVLLLLYPVEGDIRLVLMLRPDYGGVHAGQISFPGGKYEDGDESLIFTALREAQEEVGIDPREVQVVGMLTDLYVLPSNFLVTPVVAYLPFRPLFAPDDKEVARVIEVPLQAITDLSRVQRRTQKLRNGMELPVPGFVVGEDFIWGATAMILSEFCEVVNRVRS